ncbi:MAG: carbon-nitrogen hydrolase [Blastochloris sp.]|nr:carbon-nitrogen hydrolase [Blastochloris sp.]
MSSSPLVHVGLIQFACESDPQRNLDKAVARCREAAAQGAQILCLQELFRTEYFCRTEEFELFDLAETIPGPSTEALAQVARECGVVIVASLFEKRAKGLYHNTAAVLDADGSLLGIYRKMHIPEDPAFFEKFYFTPGDLGFKTFKTRYGNIGVLVCWDQWYPEAARLTALQGADILFYPTAIGWAHEEKPEVKKCQADAWQTIQRSHAIANGVFVASVNRVGSEGHLDFWGGSFVCDPFGEILKLGSQDKEEILVVPCDFNEVDVTRRHWPFVRDRRIDAYGEITKRYIDQV